MNKLQEASAARASEAVKTDTTIDTQDELICPASSIFDNDAIRAALIEAIGEAADAREVRAAAVSTLAAAQKTGRLAIEAAFEADPFNARATTRAYSYLTDQMVHEVL